MQERSKGLFAISSAALIWGFNFIGTKVLLSEADPFAVAFIRQTCTMLIFVCLWTLLGHNVLEDVRKHWRRVLPLSLLGIIGNQLFYVWGMKHTTPSHSALMYTMLPICTALFARMILHERVVLLRWVGILLGFIGAVMLATENGIDFSGELLKGDTITFGAVITFSLFMVLGKPVLMDLGAIRVLVVGYVLAFPMIIPFTFTSFMSQDWGGLSLQAWAGLIFLIVFATVIAYLCHQYALKQLSASLLSAFAYTQPVLASFFSVIFLGEILSMQFFVAFALIAIGLVVTERFKAHPGFVGGGAQ